MKLWSSNTFFWTALGSPLNLLVYGTYFLLALAELIMNNNVRTHSVFCRKSNVGIGGRQLSVENIH